VATLGSMATFDEASVSSGHDEGSGAADDLAAPPSP
jgi:hypothetical protein